MLHFNMPMLLPFHIATNRKKYFKLLPDSLVEHAAKK